GPFALVAAVALLLAELLFVAGTLWWYSASEPADHFLFVERFVGLINGYSILGPTLILCGGFLIRACFGLKLHYLVTRFKATWPLAGKEAEATPPDTQVTANSNEISNQPKSPPSEQGEPAELLRLQPKWAWGAAIAFGLFALVAAMRLRPWQSGLTWESGF